MQVCINENESFPFSADSCLQNIKLKNILRISIKTNCVCILRFKMHMNTFCILIVFWSIRIYLRCNRNTMNLSESSIRGTLWKLVAKISYWNVKFFKSEKTITTLFVVSNIFSINTSFWSFRHIIFYPQQCVLFYSKWKKNIWIPGKG